MAGVDTIFFWNDRMHVSQTTPVLTASTTQSGYAPEYVRQADLFYAWKPSDSASTDEWLKIDGGTTTWLGNATTTAYFAVAYDARSSNQNSIQLQSHSLDDGTFTGGTLTDQVTHTFDKTKITCFYSSFAIPSTAKRYYRLIQKGANRSGGNVTAKILYWAMFQTNDITSIQRDFPAHAESSYPIDSSYMVSRMQGAGGANINNKFAAPGYEFKVSMSPALDTLFKTIRDQFEGIGGWQRAIFLQKTGIPNAALSDFFLVRLKDNWKSDRSYQDQSEVSIPMKTEPWL